MATKYYGINDKWTDDDIENVIEVASEDGSVNSVMVNGVAYGGGGGGVPIFHIEWNVVNGPVFVNMNSVGIGNLLLNALYQNDTYTVIDENGIEISDGTSAIDVACFDSTGVIIQLGDGNITDVEGNATYDSVTKTITITGDCKLTMDAA